MNNNLTVIIHNGQPVADSREVAGMIDKQHSHLLRDIAGYIEILGKSNFGLADFFIEDVYVDTQGKPRPCYLLTRKGCDMVANKMTGEKGVLFTAAYVTKFEEMEKQIKASTYQLKGNSLEAIRLVNNQVGMLVGTVEEIQDRVQSLENTMTIDYGQQLTLQETARHAAMMAMGGKDKPSYKNKTISSKVFAQVWRDYKEYFQINSYKNTPRLQFERAKEYISSWKPQGAILREIEECNRQISM